MSTVRISASGLVVEEGDKVYLYSTYRTTIHKNNLAKHDVVMYKEDGEFVLYGVEARSADAARPIGGLSCPRSIWVYSPGTNSSDILVAATLVTRY